MISRSFLAASLAWSSNSPILPLSRCLDSDQSREELAIESTIYDRLGSHPYITKFLYTYNGMIVLERLQYPLRKRLWDIRDAGVLPPAKDVLRWANQI